MLHFNAVIGQKMEVDFAGKTFQMVDPLTGEVLEIVVFVAVLPYSQYIYAEGIQCRLRSAHLRGCLQELTNCVDSAEREYLPRGITEALASLDFIDSGLNVCILGPSDSGKSYLAKAIGIVACNNYKVEYHHCESLLEALVALKVQDYSKYQKRLKRICCKFRSPSRRCTDF